MKIGIYVPVFESQPGGLGTYTREMTRRLVDRFESVVLYTTTPGNVPPDWDTEVFGLPESTANGIDRRARRTLWLNTTVRNDLKRRRVDAFFSPTHEGIISCPVPQIIVVHDLTSFVVPSSYYTRLKYAYLKLVFPRILRSSTKIIAVSKNTRNDLVQHFGLRAESIAVVYEGYDATTFFPRTDNIVTALLEKHQLKKPYILYSGTFATHKNTVFLADVLKITHSWGLDMELVLTGRLDVGEFAATQRRLEEYGLWKRARPLGYVTYEELSILMRGAHAFVFPSLYEGFGLAPLEAMASGAAVISSDRASLPEVIGDSGPLLNPTDAEAWATAIANLVERSERERYQIKSVARASQFSWDKAADEISRVIVSVKGIG